MGRVLTMALGWVIAILGGFFVVAGGTLALLGGSLYYVIVGLAMILSGALIGRGDARGRWLFIALWLGTAVWAVWEVGFDALQLIPRVVAPTVLLILVLLTGWRRARPRAYSRAVPAFAAGVAALVGGTLLLRDQRVEAQGAMEPARTGPANGSTTGEADGDWRDYGGTLSGRRYSALGDITPANVGKLQLAWTQRTGDLPDVAETTEHKREYHSEATPIHIGDTLYTCTPHSFVQAIDATTGRTKWSWNESAKRAGNNYLVCRGVAHYEAPAGTPCPNRIFATTFNAKLVALDADTGKICAQLRHQRCDRLAREHGRIARLRSDRHFATSGGQRAADHRRAYYRQRQSRHPERRRARL